MTSGERQPLARSRQRARKLAQTIISDIYASLDRCGISSRAKPAPPFFLPSAVTFNERTPLAHLPNMRLSILSLGLRGERVVLRAGEAKSFLLQ